VGKGEEFDDMPKLKTHRGAAKRFRRRARASSPAAAFKRHILTSKSTKVKRSCAGPSGIEAPHAAAP
jgi:large subunit ribosomal protein L35